MMKKRAKTAIKFLSPKGHTYLPWTGEKVVRGPAEWCAEGSERF
jgi:hypothetical protein